MGYGDLRALVLETNLWAHGVPITVRTALGQPVIATDGIWLTTETEEALGGLSRGGRAQLGGWREARHVLAISRAVLDVIPTHTQIQAPEQAGGDVKAWIVDTVIEKRADHTRVIVRPDPDGAW